MCPVKSTNNWKNKTIKNSMTTKVATSNTLKWPFCLSITGSTQAIRHKARRSDATGEAPSNIKAPSAFSTKIHQLPSESDIT